MTEPLRPGSGRTRLRQATHCRHEHMDEVLVIPDDLETCQRLLRELLSAHVEWNATCESLRVRLEKLEQENQEQELTIKALLRQLYGRRSERFVEGRGQQHFHFGDEPLLGDPSIVSAAQQDPILQEFVVRRRQGVRQRSEKLPDHLERRTQRIEPRLPEGIQLGRLCPDRRRRGGNSGDRARGIMGATHRVSQVQIAIVGPITQRSDRPTCRRRRRGRRRTGGRRGSRGGGGDRSPRPTRRGSRSSRTCKAHRRARLRS